MKPRQMLLAMLLLSLLPTIGAAAEKPARNKQPPITSSATLVPLAFDQLVTLNRTLTGHASKIRALAYTQDNRLLFSGGDDKSLIAWNVRTGEQAWAARKLPGQVAQISVCANGELLAIATDGEDIMLLDAGTGAHRAAFRTKGDVRALSCPTRLGLLAAATEDKEVVVWDLDKLRQPPAEPSAPREEGDGYFDWLKGKGDKKSEAQARADKAVIKTLKSGDRDLLSLAFNPNGTYLAAAGKEKQVQVWETTQWQPAKILTGIDREVRALVFSRDGGRLAAVEDKRKILLWDLYGKPLPRLLGTERDDIAALTFSADGAILVTAGKKRIALWSTRTNREIHAIVDDRRETLSVQASPDNSQLAAAGEDKSIRLWNLPGIVSLAAAEASRNDALKALDLERDERIKALYPKKSEFESSREFSERMKRAKAEEQRLRNEYAGRRKAMAVEIEEEAARLKKEYYPYTGKGELGKYDADQGLFHGTLGGAPIRVPVPASRAKELAGNRDKLVFSGMIRYHDQQNGELVNGYLLDQTSGARFPFGRQVSGITSPLPTTAPLPASAARRKAPPALEIVSLTLVEPSGNNALDAGEHGSIRVNLRNAGSGSAEGVAIVLRPEGETTLPPSLTVTDRLNLGEIAPNQTRSIELPIAATEELPARELRLKITALEADGFDSQPLLMAFSLKPMVPPDLQLAKIEISDAEGKRVITRGKEANLTITVKNAGSGPARGVKARIDCGDQQVKLFSDSEVALGLIKPGESRRATFTIAVTQRYKGPSTLPVSFQVMEERPRFGFKPQLQLTLNKEAPEVRLVKVKERETAPVATDQDDIGMAPLFAVTRRAFTASDLAVVIGIERYQSVPKSDFAYNDARAVKSYLLSLGFRERNIEFLADERATLSAIRKSLESWLPNRVKPESRIFFYYSGHGAPDPATGEAFIVPFDGDPSYLNDTGYPIKRLYEKLSAAKAAEVIVVMDSCFSGSGGRSVMAKGARPLVLMTEPSGVPDRMAILASTQGSQISTSFQEKEHGVFTYYFLKAIKEGRSDIEAIYRYLKPLVEDTAKSQNVTQSPVLSKGSSESQGMFRVLNE